MVIPSLHLHHLPLSVKTCSFLLKNKTIEENKSEISKGNHLLRKEDLSPLTTTIEHQRLILVKTEGRKKGREEKKEISSRQSVPVVILETRE